MKLKGIPFIEQHIEKMILGVAVLGLVGVAAWQFLGRPNAVDMGTMKGVEPGRVDGILKERAEAIAQKLREDARPDPDPFARELPKVSDRFAAALAEGTRGPDDLPRIAAAMGRELQPIDLGADTWYHVPVLPAPAMLAAVSQSADALSDEAIQRHPELAARFPDPAMPKDIVWPTPAAVIDPQAILSELRRSDASSKPPKAQVPTPWFNDTLYVVDVVFSREELQSDGTWGKSTVVNPIPGQVTFRPRLTAQADARLRDDIFTRLADRATQQAILQPDFLPTRNDAFSPPALPSEGGKPQGNDQVDEIASRISRLKADRDRKAKELKDIGGPLDEAPKDKDKDKGKDDGKDDGGKRGGGGLAPPGGGSGLGGGFAGNRGSDVAAGDAEKNKSRRIGLTKAIRQLDERIGRFEAELKALAPEVVAEAGDAGGFNLMGDQPILVWAHDLDAEPGKTYRYRSQLRVYNPFFTRARQLVKEQVKLADQVVLESAQSDWSNPVEMAPPVEFFLVRANPGEGPLGLGTARVEVYRLFDGKWRLEEFTVSPGDRIGRVVDAQKSATKGEPPKGAATGGAAAAGGPVDFTTDWYVVDIVEDQTGERKGAGDSLKPAIVIIERVGDGERLELREPARELVDEQRKRLNRDSKLGAIG